MYRYGLALLAFHYPLLTCPPLTCPLLVQDFDCVYRYGLALQELAGRLAAQPADQLALLHQAAEVYLEASRLAGDRHAAVLCKWARRCAELAACSCCVSCCTARPRCSCRLCA